MKWKFEELISFMDGGTLLIKCLDENNCSVDLYLTQYVFSDYYEEISKISGRVYENETILAKRSNRELEIIEYLEHDLVATISHEYKKILKAHLSFIKSSEYVEFVPNKLDIKSRHSKTRN